MFAIDKTKYILVPGTHVMLSLHVICAELSFQLPE